MLTYDFSQIPDRNNLKDENIWLSSPEHPVTGWPHASKQTILQLQSSIHFMVYRKPRAKQEAIMNDPPLHPYRELSKECHQCPAYQHMRQFLAKTYQQRKAVLMLVIITRNKVNFSKNWVGGYICTMECCLANLREKWSFRYIDKESSLQHILKWPNSRIWCCMLLL